MLPLIANLRLVVGSIAVGKVAIVAFSGVRCVVVLPAFRLVADRTW